MRMQVDYNGKTYISVHNSDIDKTVRDWYYDNLNSLDKVILETEDGRVMFPKTALQSAVITFLD